MWRKSFMLGTLVCAYATVALATPGIIPIFPIRNITTPVPTSEPTTSCAAQCSVEYPQLTAVQWIPESQIIYTTKITVATYRHIIVTSGNFTIATRSTVIFDDVPPQYELYSVTTGPAGTVVVNVPITNSDGVYHSEFTYPTPYIDYATEYRWQGVLQTYDEDFNRACSTAAPKFALVPLPPKLHPEYPQPKEVGAGKLDPSGVAHRPIWGPVKAEPEVAFFQVAFPDEAAFSYCEYYSAEVPLPTEYEAPMFLTETETVWTTAATDGIRIESSATGFLDPTTSDKMLTPNFPRVETTVSGFEQPTASNNVVDTLTHDVDRPRSTATGFGQEPNAQQSGNPGSPGINTPLNPGFVITPMLPTPTPIFTFVPTTINGQPTSVPAFIIPGSSTTATIGQTITLNGRPTVLAPPPPIFIQIPTTINGVVTSAPAFIISGSITATLGQTVTLNGQPTVLSAPSSVWTTISTTINGIPTTTLAYIISGSITATLGQTIMLNGQPTVLTAPPAVFTLISTTINGIPTTVPAYVISGSITATVGQTVTISGTTTVISFPTGTEGVVTTSTAGEKVTGTSTPGKGTGSQKSIVTWNAAIIGLAAAFVMWL